MLYPATIEQVKRLPHGTYFKFSADTEYGRQKYTGAVFDGKITWFWGGEAPINPIPLLPYKYICKLAGIV